MPSKIDTGGGNMHPAVDLKIEARMSRPALRVPKHLDTAAIRISRRAAARIRSGHLWVYRSDLQDAIEVPRASVTRVVDDAGAFLGTALSSSSSQIALRMISSGELTDGEIPSVIRERLVNSIEYRRRLGIPESTNAYRLVFSEADQLPGLIVDQYNDVLAFQVLTQVMDREDVRNLLLDTLQEQLQPAGIFERVEPRIRELESLPPITGGLARGSKAATDVEMNRSAAEAGLKFHCDLSSGQKTGAFLDQRENYAAVSRYAHGAALDVFCYQGGFALHMARTCSRVTGVDASRPALETAEQNFHLNRPLLAPLEIEWIEGNAFDLLRDWSGTGQRFGTVVLDPPAFAKSKRALPTALRGYKELNLRALKMLDSGGILVTCSCSHHVSREEFLVMLAEAARDARRRIRLLEIRGQSQDHPVVASIPETEYLKCVIAYVE
jgi:23S rRNA (cytosine1962-C5)-methyltransferase